MLQTRTDRPSFFEPPTALLKKHYLLFWLTFGVGACALTWYLSGSHWSLQERAGFTLITAIFCGFLPAAGVFMTRLARELVERVKINSQSNGSRNSNDINLSGILSIRYLPFLLTLIASFLSLLMSSYFASVALDYPILTPERSFMFIGVAVSMFIMSIAVAAGVQCSRIAAQLPAAHFYVSFQHKGNELVALLARYLNQGTLLAVLLWGLTVAALYLIGMQSEPSVMGVVLVTSFFPIAGAFWSLTRTREIESYARMKDLSLVGGLVGDKLAKLNSDSANEVAALNALLDLQGRVSQARDDSFRLGSLVALFLASLPPIAQLIQQLLMAGP